MKTKLHMKRFSTQKKKYFNKNLRGGVKFAKRTLKMSRYFSKLIIYSSVVLMIKKNFIRKFLLANKNIIFIIIFSIYINEIDLTWTPENRINQPPSFNALAFWT